MSPGLKGQSLQITSQNVVFHANMFEHTPNVEHPEGLFGTFKEALITNHARHSRTQKSKETVKLNRLNVVLYNVRHLGQGKQRRLPVSVLRCLAEAVPEPQYVVPEVLPSSHKHDDQISDDENDDTTECSRKSVPNVRALKRARLSRSKAVEDEDEEDEDEDEEDDDSLGGG